MYCSTCGTLIPDKASFCPECGSPVSSGGSRDSSEAEAFASQEAETIPVPDASPAPDVVPVPGAPSKGEPKPRHGAVTLGLCILLVGLAFIFQVIGAIIAYFAALDLDFMVTVFGAIGACLGVCIMGGERMLLPDRASLLYAWKEGWWVVAVSLILALLEAVSTIVEGETLFTSGWLLRSLGVLALCLGVGVSEEAAFRGLLFEGMLDATGKHKRGIVAAAVVSSLLFGMAHVVGSFDFRNALDVAQGVLKTVQTGTYGFFLAALVLKTRKLWGAVLLHALDDFLLMLPSVGLQGLEIDLQYVSAGEDAIPTIILYSVIIICYLPLVWRGIRMLREVDAPQLGEFHRG